MNMRDFWANEAAMMRDTSGVLGKEVLKPVNSSLSPKNTTSLFVDFDSNKVVMWVAVKQDNPRLRVGQKVIRLSRKYESGAVMIVFWNGKKYDFALIKDSSLINRPLIDSVYDNFVNDVSHAYSRVEIYNGKIPLLDTKVIKKIKPSNIEWLRSATDQSILALYNKFKYTFRLNSRDRVETLNRYTSTIFSAYNPQSEEGTYQETTLFLPLSEDWFRGDEKLNEHFTKFWVPNGNLNRFVGYSGEGVIGEKLVEIKAELLRLKNIVKDTTAKNTPEASWLQQLNPTNLKNIKRVFFISNGTWGIRDDARYAEGIALMNSIGIFQAPPLLSVLLHEMNVNSDTIPFFPFDTHLPPEYTKEIWEKSKEDTTFEKNVLNDINSIDKLYQSVGCINALVLSIILTLK
jgi:hypothetical protein